ncbi:MAG: hypothetical protein ACTSWM_06070 [Alphaproteobacteria bacterium]
MLFFRSNGMGICGATALAALSIALWAPPIATAEEPTLTFESLKPFPRTAPSRTATQKAERAHIARLGLTLATLTAELAVSHGIAFATEGLMVVGVDAEGPGARSDVRIGDVVQEIDQDTVGTPGDIAGTLANAAPSERRSHLVLLERSGEILFRVLRAVDLAPRR